MKFKDIERWVKGIIVFFIALYLFLSLISFDPFDPTFKFCQIGSPVNTEISHFGGRVGSYIAGLLIFIFGKGAYLLVFLLLFSAYNVIWGEKINFGKKIISIFGIVFVFSIFLSLQTKNFSGGFLGSAFTPYLKEFFGEKGIYLILILLFVVFFGLVYKMFVSPFQFLFAREVLLTTEEGKEILRKKPVMKKRVIKKNEQGPEIEEKEVQKEKSEQKVIITTKQKNFVLPPVKLLKSDTFPQKETKDDFERYAQVIEETLSEFDIEGEVVQINQGPRVTMFEIQLAPGIPVQKIFKIQDNIAMNLKTTSIRIVAPLPNKSTVGVEVPNREISIVYLKELIASKEFQKSPSKLTIAIGKDIMGRPVVSDLKIMPHLLIAGATGSGKTVCLNSLITSILYKATPDEVKFILIDPKMVELTLYNGIPHLLCPVVIDIKKAVNVLKWVIQEMERRYKLFSERRVRNIETYNLQFKEEKLPYVVIVIDELADLMIVAKNEIEQSIIRLAQLSRAAGIHLILATQRPSVNVITGVIKANLPCRISFQVTSKFDSRTILDKIGAEKLLGRGDLLFIPPQSSIPLRIQGSFISDEEIESICNFLKNQSSPQYNMEILEKKLFDETEIEHFSSSSAKLDDDILYQEAKNIVLTTKIASISMLQRRLNIGFNRAAKFVEKMEEEGIVGPYIEGKPRKVLISNENRER
ncbi:MAG TPA: DNA translocase FtsK [Candidatus Ratteibacteria bacterium]|nr:DNA translocase FtsK [Candidatus Ratteibacteria bacterium]